MDLFLYVCLKKVQIWTFWHSKFGPFSFAYLKMVQIQTYSYVKFEKLQYLDLSIIPNFDLFVTYALEIPKFGPFDMYILELFDIYLLRRSKFGPFCIFFTICIFLIRISYKVPNLDLFIRPEFGLFYTHVGRRSKFHK